MSQVNVESEIAVEGADSGREAVRRKWRRALFRPADEQFRGQLTDGGACRHAMPAEARHPEEILKPWVPADDEAPVRRQSSESGPALVDAHAGERRHNSLDLSGQQLFDAFLDRRIAGRQFGLIAGAEQQPLALRTKINIMRNLLAE